MKPFDLDSQLKRVPVPQRPDEYWEVFPRRVRVRVTVSRMAREPFPSRRPQWAWAGGFAGALVLALLIWGGQHQFEHFFSHALRQDLAQLPQNLKTFMSDEHGQHALVSDPEQ